MTIKPLLLIIVLAFQVQIIHSQFSFLQNFESNWQDSVVWNLANGLYSVKRTIIEKDTTIQSCSLLITNELGSVKSQNDDLIQLYRNTTNNEYRVNEISPSELSDEDMGLLSYRISNDSILLKCGDSVTLFTVENSPRKSTMTLKSAPREHQLFTHCIFGIPDFNQLIIKKGKTKVVSEYSLVNTVTHRETRWTEIAVVHSHGKPEIKFRQAKGKHEITEIYTSDSGIVQCNIYSQNKTISISYLKSNGNLVKEYIYYDQDNKREKTITEEYVKATSPLPWHSK